MSRGAQPADDPIELGGSPPDATEMSEGIGGVPDIDSDERATVSDVDGDNVETERPKPEV